ncbi:MAG: hypothetical protein HRT41_02270 [Campylobacteraceae bacterium]|nr:hypothetical protein [Campylobacteraceae bacterium]
MFVKMNRSGNFRGSKYSKDEIIEVGEDLGNRIISNGQGSKSSEAEFKKAIEDAKEKDKKESNKTYSEMNMDELKAVDYDSLNRAPLEEFALAIGISNDAAKDAKKKDDLIALIETSLKEEK